MNGVYDMSRIGKKPVTIPAGVDVKVDGYIVTVKGPKGTLKQELTGAIGAEVDAGTKELKFTRSSEMRSDRAKHGLYRSIVNNMIEGVTKGYMKELEIQGVGYRAELSGDKKKLRLFVGYNTKIPEIYSIPEGVKVTLAQPTQITVEGIDKQLVGQVAASIRLVRIPDVYKGKGVRYKGEVVRKLPGKTVAATGIKRFQVPGCRLRTKNLEPRNRALIRAACGWSGCAGRRERGLEITIRAGGTPAVRRRESAA